jgi:hypothetical protein
MAHKHLVDYGKGWEEVEVEWHKWPSVLDWYNHMAIDYPNALRARIVGGNGIIISEESLVDIRYALAAKNPEIAERTKKMIATKKAKRENAHQRDLEVVGAAKPKVAKKGKDAPAPAPKDEYLEYLTNKLPESGAPNWFTEPDTCPPEFAEDRQVFNDLIETYFDYSEDEDEDACVYTLMTKNKKLNMDFAMAAKEYAESFKHANGKKTFVVIREADKGPKVWFAVASNVKRATKRVNNPEWAK